MATITAELLPNSAAIRLSLNVAAGIKSIIRRDANGINDVRTGPGVFGIVPELAFAGTNLIKNPSFETGISGVGKVGTTVTLTASTYAPGLVVGAGGLMVDVGAGANSNTYIFQTVDVTAGNWLAAALNVRANSDYLGSVRLGIMFYDSTGASIAGSLTKSAPFDPPSNSTGGARYSFSALAPANAKTANVYVYSYGDTAGSTAPAAGTRYFTDAWAACESATQAQAEYMIAQYFDGSYAPSLEFKTAWTGTAHASTSTRSVPASAVVVTDYEAASGPVRYDVIDLNDRLESLDVAGFALDAPWLFTPLIPGYSRKAVSVTGLDTEFEDRSTVHSGLLGRPDPVVVLRPLGLRSGTMEIYAGTYADALEILSPLQRATVMMLRQPEHAGLDMYFAPAGGSPKILSLVTDGGRTVWGVQVPYVEVKRPEGMIAGALGWTYADLAAAVPRYSDLPRTFATYADMRINKRITP